MKKVLLARFTVESAGADTVRQLMLDYAEAVRAEAGNLLFAPATLVADPNAYWVYEEYADDDAFAAHLASDHCAAFNAAIAPWVLGGASTLIDLDAVEHVTV